MNWSRIMALSLALAVFAAAVLAAENPTGENTATSEKPAASPDAKYSKIADKNIFYPTNEAAAAANPSQVGSPGNGQGTGLLLTGVVQAGAKVYVVIQNTGTGESSIVSPGESTGGGQVVTATLEGITLSTESGSFKIPVGYYLSGAQGPETAPAARTSEAPSGAQAGEAPHDQQVSPEQQSAAAQAQAGAPAQGQAAAAQGNPGPPDSGGRRWGGRRGFSQEQMDTFRNMTPEQRDQLRQSMRQRRGRRDNNGEQNQ